EAEDGIRDALRAHMSLHEGRGASGQDQEVEAAESVRGEPSEAGHRGGIVVRTKAASIDHDSLVGQAQPSPRFLAAQSVRAEALGVDSTGNYTNGLRTRPQLRTLPQLVGTRVRQDRNQVRARQKVTLESLDQAIFRSLARPIAAVSILIRQEAPHIEEQVSPRNRDPQRVSYRRGKVAPGMDHV